MHQATPPELAPPGPFRVGVIGAGAMGALHLEALQRLRTRFRVVAVADPDIERAARLGAPLGARAYADHRAMAAGEDLDAAIVASPNAHHHGQAIDLIELGIPTLVEKPMAGSAAEAREMARVSAERGVPLVVGHVQRYLPRVASAARLLADGAIGELTMIVDQYASRYERGTRPDWFLDPRVSPHGILANLGSHILDRCLLFAGATSVDVHGAWLRRDPVPIDGVASLRARGVPATLVLAGTGLPAGETTQLLGTEGAIRLRTATGLELFRRGEATYREAPGGTDDLDAFEAQLVAFGRVLEGAEPEVGAAYGIAILDAIERISAAARAP